MESSASISSKKLSLASILHLDADNKERCRNSYCNYKTVLPTSTSIGLRQQIIYGGCLTLARFLSYFALFCTPRTPYSAFPFQLPGFCTVLLKSEVMIENHKIISSLFWSQTRCACDFSTHFYYCKFKNCFIVRLGLKFCCAGLEMGSQATVTIITALTSEIMNKTDRKI